MVDGSLKGWSESCPPIRREAEVGSRGYCYFQGAERLEGLLPWDARRERRYEMW